MPQSNKIQPNLVNVLLAEEKYGKSRISLADLLCNTCKDCIKVLLPWSPHTTLQ